MKSFESDIKRIAEKTRLKAIEREAIRDRILSYMEYHPLKKEREEFSTPSAGQYADVMYISWNSFWVRATSGVLALLLIVGVPLFAERAVPGDILYLVKTEVNETIRTQLASSPYEKVELETKLIERRIAEARLLAQEGKLTSEVEAKIAETVKGHANAVQDGIAELRTQDADGAAIAEIVFSSSLEVQSAVLGVSGESKTSPVGSILDVVNTVRDDVAASENTAPSYEGLLARIELETTRTYELFESVKAYATPEEVADIERRLADIDRSIVAAKELKPVNEAGAVNEMTNVLSHIQKLITFMTDIDVRQIVALEALVPVILTLEERTDVVSKRIAEAEEKLVVVDMRIASSSTTPNEKAVAGRELASTLIASATEAITQGDIARAETLSVEVATIATDLLTLTGGDIASTGIPSSEELLPPSSEDATTSPSVVIETGTTTESTGEGSVPESVVE